MLLDAHSLIYRAYFALLETQWQGVPQLWVQTPGVDAAVINRVEGRDGVHAQWVLDKDISAGQRR